MEGHGHDAVRQVEGLLHAVAVVDVDVDVENPGVVPESQEGRCEAGEQRHPVVVAAVLQVVLLEQLQDADDDVVDVAKTRRLRGEKPTSAVQWFMVGGVSMLQLLLFKVNG